MLYEDTTFMGSSPARTHGTCRENGHNREVAECRNDGTLDMTNAVAHTDDPTEAATREKVHELRNRLYASSLALRAICTMLDKGNTRAARAAAETMLAKLSDELDESRDSAPNTTDTRTQAGRLHVLIVEDDDMEAQLLSGYLSEEGYEVSRARDGIDALSQLKAGPLPDLVLLDMNMPRLDGPKTITSIRSDESLRDLTLIAISGTDATTTEMQKARRSVNFWITKPADPERITAAILELARPCG